MEAELLSFDKGIIELRKRSGDVIKVELKKLCLEDYRFVRRYVASTRGADRPSGTGPSRPSPARAVELAKDGPTTLELKRHVLEPPKSSAARSRRRGAAWKTFG